jgi:DNA-binding transcriptional LysR family regulator
MHEAAGVDFVVRHRVREMSTLFALVGQGFGVSIVPSLGRGMLPPGLRMLPLTVRQARHLVLAGPRGGDWHPLVGALIEAASPRNTMSDRVGSARLDDIPAPVGMPGR